MKAALESQLGAHRAHSLLAGLPAPRVQHPYPQVRFDATDRK